MKKLWNSPVAMLFLAFVLWFAGALLINREEVEPLKQMGIAQQEDYTYEDGNGNEHEGETLISIDGLGKVLTYKDIYLAPFGILMVSWLVGYFLFEVNNNTYAVKYGVFGNCILGVLLIWITTESNLPSTILYWLGIFAAWRSATVSR